MVWEFGRLICRWLQPFGVSERHCGSPSFGDIFFSVDQRWHWLKYVCRSFATLLPGYGKPTDRFSVPLIHRPWHWWRKVSCAKKYTQCHSCIGCIVVSFFLFLCGAYNLATMPRCSAWRCLVFFDADWASDRNPSDGF